MEEQLRDAVFEDNLPTVRRILQGGAVNVNASASEDGWTALHWAVRISVVGIVQAILQVEGVNVNARTMEGLYASSFFGLSPY